MANRIFPNQLKYYDIKRLKTQKLYIVSDYHETHCLMQEEEFGNNFEIIRLKDGLNYSGDLFHFCEVKDVFKFIDYQTYVREVTIPERDMLIFDMIKFDYILKTCYGVKCEDDCAMNRHCRFKGYIRNQDRGGYMADGVWLSKRRLIWDLKTMKSLIAEGADPNQISETGVGELIKYGKLEIFKLFYELTNGFESIEFIHPNYVFDYYTGKALGKNSSLTMNCETKAEKLHRLALWSIMFERRNFLQFLIEQGLIVDDEIFLGAWNKLQYINSPTCFKYLYNLNLTDISHCKWFQDEVDLWYKTPEEKAKLFESLKIKQRVKKSKAEKSQACFNKAIGLPTEEEKLLMRKVREAAAKPGACFRSATWFSNS
jgi:hypothetical protein